MSPNKKPKSAAKSTPDPHLNDLMEQLLTLQQEEKERNAFSQRVGKTGTFTWDLRSKTATWTREFEALYGFPNGGYKGGTMKSWYKYVHSKDRKRVTTETESVLKNGNEMNIEFRVIWPDKSVHHLLTRARIIRDSNGNALEVSGVNIDISERKQIEINLEYLSQASKILASSLNYQDTLKVVAKLGVPEIADWCSVDILTSSNEIKRLAVAHKDPKQVKWAWESYKRNPPQMDQSTGLPKVLKTGVPEFYPVITQEMIEAAAKSPEHLELLQKLNFHSVMIVPLIVEGSSIGAISFVSTDSNRHFSRADLTVAEEVASRAALAIHNSRLFTDAQNAIALRDEFISVASHELKTPVTSLKMYTQIMMRQLQKQSDQHTSAPIFKMNAQIDKLTNLINDLLNISKIQSGKLEFLEEFFSISDVIKDTVESVQSGHPSHTIHIEGKAKKLVYGDKDRISQVITNLLTNAIKYSPDAHKVILTISEKKDQIEIAVQDFGIGIDKEQQRKIFNRFYRVNDSHEKTFPGLGIGLYISSEIVRRHGSNIVVSSNKGKGSIFSFTLPYTKPQ